MSLSTELIRLIRAKEADAADFDRAALFVLDAAASSIGGTHCSEGRQFLNWGLDEGHIGAEGLRSQPGRAAFLLGALSHALEIDDLHRDSALHPGCVVVPVLWGRSWENGGATGGRHLLKAVLHGYEAAIRIGRAVGPAHYKLWHNTATCGPFGAAMAAATLLGLDDKACADALGNAGTQSSGLWEFLDSGALTKPLHAGRAAESGLTAAELAQHGVTGAPAILEGERGFFAAMCPDAEPDLVLGDPGDPWQLHTASIKPWPSCRHTHPTIDAAQELRQSLAARGLDAGAVEGIEIATYGAALGLCDNPAPDSVLAAKFSLQHCVSAALATNEVWFDAFETSARRALAPLRAKCSVSNSPEFEQRYPGNWGAEVSITVAGGERITAMRQNAKGDPELPLEVDALKAKAARLLRLGGVAQPDQFIDAVLATADGAPLPRLPGLLGGESEPASVRSTDIASRTGALN